MTTIRIRFLIPFVLFGIAASASAQPVEYSRQLATGVALFQTIYPDGPMTISGVKVDLKAPGVRLGAFVAKDTINQKDREIVSDAVRRHGAIAGTNADFFPWTADPLGLTFIDGRLVSEPYQDRPAFGVTSDGKVLMGIVQMALTFEFPGGRLVKPTGVDRPMSGGELIVYDRYYGASTGAGTDCAEMTLKIDWVELGKTGEVTAQIQQLLEQGQNSRIPGDGVVLVAKGPRVTELLAAAAGATSVKVKLILWDEDGRSWLGVRDCVGGEPWLVKHGEVYDYQGRLSADTSFARRNPRTLAGVTKNGSVVLVVIDGRQITSRGATLKEEAQIMLNLGCTDAINLDGGGSSALVVQDMVINSPSDGQQRPCASGLLVYAPQNAAAESQQLAVSPSDARLVAGTRQEYTVAKTDGTQLTPAEMRSVVWGTKNGGGFMNQGGSFTALRAGSPVIMARWNDAVGQTTATISPAGGENLKLTWDEGSPGTAAARTLIVTARDALGNAAAWEVVNLKIIGGTGDAQVKCGPDGIGRATITWDPAAAARSVEVTSRGVTAKLSNQ